MDNRFRFRAWNRIVKRMQYFTLPDLEQQKGKIQWQNLDIMEFTGREDSGHTDIYEGDIVRWKSIPEWHTQIDATFVVRHGEMHLWSDQSYAGTIGFYLEDIKSNVGYGLNTIKHAYIESEVVGNIYDNPELLREHIKQNQDATR